MGKIDVDLKRLKGQQEKLESLKAEVEKIGERLDNVNSHLDTIGLDSSISDLKKAVNKNLTEISSLSEAIFSLGSSIDSIRTMYTASEEVLLGKSPMGDLTFSLFGSEFKRDIGIPFGSTTFSFYLGKLASEHGAAYFDKFSLEAGNGLSSENSFKDEKGDNIAEKLEESAEKHNLRREGQNTVYIDDEGTHYDKDGREIDSDGNVVKDGKRIDTDENPIYNREATLAQYEKRLGGSVSLFDGSYTFGDGSEVSAKVGTAEAYGSVAMGLYVVGKDGSRMFSPGVSAEIGTSVTAFEGNWNKQLAGDENLGLNADATVTAGKAEAKADAEFQVLGKDGDLDVQLGAHASAEAIAAKAEGKVGVNVLGGEASVKGGVQVGVGAHADIGIRDGKIKCDVGAALGVGASLDFELDVGGMVNTVAGKASSIFN